MDITLLSLIEKTRKKSDKKYLKSKPNRIAGKNQRSQKQTQMNMNTK